MEERRAAADSISEMSGRATPRKQVSEIGALVCMWLSQAERTREALRRIIISSSAYMKKKKTLSLT
jgi:hypothetical protein